jgi:quercetin 2,3-dioxygenase
MGFGVLRVLNDDVLQGGSGLGVHKHDNMEIISVPLQGALTHGDNTGHASVIRTNDVQVMSAGTGIMHTERNSSSHEPVSFLQLWILPKAQNLSLRYAQGDFDPKTWENQFVFLIVPTQQQGKLSDRHCRFLVMVYMYLSLRVRPE